MDQTALLTKIRNILHERYGLAMNTLREDVRLRDLGIDSLYVAEIMIDLETELGADMNVVSMPPDPSLGEVVAVISKNLASQA
ncbi:acyl carrier protein [Hyalangium rubrum]|uniref:Acyl carrier protein n=1 Tax=Hyalangium rubrum TaxID=3103134 RepID=A0ABU5GYB3_9BACT|nr:acyl carrier protein [Hyalangium sp. s54d21]MDY7226155.1 acyl carrier protein [Hyalangium sp. s54d21]